MTEKRLAREWESAAFNRETNEWDHTTLKSYEYVPDISSDLFIRQAAPTIVRPSRRKKPSRLDSRTLIAGDSQIPFHDENAHRSFIQAVAETQPDNVVFTGDMLDLPSLSRFTQRSEWADTTQAAIDTYHNFLAEVRANAPDATIAVVHGNHEQRMDDYVRNNAREVLGLKRANMPKELAVLTLQYLVRYEDLDVISVDGYPNGTYWLEDNMKVVHGTNVAKGGSNAAKYLREERDTTIYGHTHRQELAYRTFARQIGHATIAAASPGCLAKIDGSVPGFRHTVDAQGELVKRAEDWQQGLLVVDHNERLHHITPVLFQEDGFMLDGKKYGGEE